MLSYKKHQKIIIKEKQCNRNYIYHTGHYFLHHKHIDGQCIHPDERIHKIEDKPWL